MHKHKTRVQAQVERDYAGLPAQFTTNALYCLWKYLSQQS